MSAYQLFPALDPATEAALRASIVRFGVLVPVVHDQNGQTIDGHHRERIAAELGAPVEIVTVTVADAEEAREVALTLNADRRHLTTDQRRAIVADLRAEGHSLRAIAGAVGAPKSTVADDAKKVSGPGHLTPAAVHGRDGKAYPAHREHRPLPPAPGHGETPTVTEARRRFEAEVEAAGGPGTDEGQRLLEHAEEEEARLVAEVAAEAPESDTEALASLRALLDAVEAIREEHDAARLAAAVPEARRQKTWRDLRRAGEFLASIALRLEEER